jgi:hypothetical protein
MKGEKTCEWKKFLFCSTLETTANEDHINIIEH